jgi:hypothetical protein
VNLPVHLLPAAREELDQAAAFYGSQQTGLAIQFLSEADEAIRRIEANPYAWSAISARSRRCRLHRFPYALIYQIRSMEVMVIAAMHLHRDPGYWRDRES